MPANTPNIGAINSMGEQFKNDVAGKLKTHLTTVAKNSQAKHVERIRQDVAARNQYAAGVNQAIRDSQKQANAHAKAQKAAQGAAKKAAASQASAVKSGRQAPAQGAPPRTFAVPTSPAQKTAASQAAQAQRQHQRTMTQQVNNAHGEALKMQSAQFKTMQQQRNNAHGQAIKEAGQRAKAAGKVVPPTAPSKTGKTPTMNGPQFADKTPEDNSPHPTAQFPEGASKQVLPHLSESLSEPGKPQTFTQGAYTMKPGGIAARGSQLESWAQTKSNAVQARRKSQQAGGRDRNLAAAAREWENAANKPMDLEG